MERVVLRRIGSMVFFLFSAACGGSPQPFDCTDAPNRQLSASQATFLGPTAPELLQLIPLGLTTTATYGHNEKVDLSIVLDVEEQTALEYEYHEVKDGYLTTRCVQRVEFPVSVELKTADGVYNERFEDRLAIHSFELAVVTRTVDAADMQGTVVQRFEAGDEEGTLFDFQISIMFVKREGTDELVSQGDIRPSLRYEGGGALAGGLHGYASLQW